MKNFEEYLRQVHAKQYKGTDDDMPDDFDNWLVCMDREELINHADLYAYKIKK